MKVSFLVGTLATGALLSACVGTPIRSPNPLGHQNPDRDLATSEQYPLRSDPVKAEVDRQFEDQYPGVINWIWVWGKDRWFDILDVVSWDLSFGRGFAVNVMATEFAQAGIGWWDGTSWGARGRAWGTWDEHLVQRGLGPFYWIETERSSTWGTQSLFAHDYKYTGWDLFEEAGNKATQHDWSEVGAQANLLAFGLRASASPIEVCDLAAGLFPVGLVTNILGYHHPIFDIMQDDTHSKIENALREEKGLGQ